MTPTLYRKDFRRKRVSLMQTTKTTYINWLTLECGHKVRKTGIKAPKSALCYQCFHEAKYGESAE